MKFVWYLLYNLIGAFCVRWVEALSNDFSEEMPKMIIIIIIIIISITITIVTYISQFPYACSIVLHRYSKEIYEYIQLKIKNLVMKKTW